MRQATGGQTMHRGASSAIAKAESAPD